MQFCAHAKMLKLLQNNLKNFRLYSTTILESPIRVDTQQKPITEIIKPRYIEPRQVWVENFDTVKEKKTKIVELHPDVFATTPRIDIIHQNVEWQRKYRYVSFAHTKIRMEVRGGGRKPWPQKGLGRARHGSIRSPLWRGGGVIHGPRSPTSHFYMLPFFNRVLGLTSTLSVKLAQDDLHIVNDFEIPSGDPRFIKQLIDERNWGPSVLLVDTTDIMPRNLTLALDELKHVNMMPLYGLNVYSMLKYDTLVLSEAAVEVLHEKLLTHLNCQNGLNKMQKYRTDQ